MQFLLLPFSSLSNDIGYVSLHFKTFSVKQKHQKPTNSLIDNNNQITNTRSVLKLWLPELLMWTFWDYSRTLLWAQLNMLEALLCIIWEEIFSSGQNIQIVTTFLALLVLKMVWDLIMVCQLISICLKLWIKSKFCG